MKKPKIIFVFGSNLAGIHGKGAAKWARENYGAIIGEGKGRTGNAYAIPTKNKKLKTLPLRDIRYYVSQFNYYCTRNPNLIFFVTRIGCGLAGYTDKQIAPLFKDTPRNCVLPKEWWEYIK